MQKSYDIIVIGGGHAGCEAAHAAAKMNCRTLLISTDLDKLATMPCNPAIGGPGKSHLVREIDALGGIMGKLTDETLIQIRLLNTSKGPAVQAYRAQIEKQLYMKKMRQTLENTKNLDLLEDEATEIKKSKDRITGIKIKSGQIIKCKAIIVGTGTFLNGKIITGKKECSGGRIDAPASKYLSKSLKKLGLKIGRLKTGTPPRIDKDSINYKKMVKQPGTPGPLSFSFPGREIIKSKDQTPCFLTYTTPKTHKLVLKYKHLSPIYSGQITEAAPRHCPSLDRKIINFPDRNRHPIFVEPTGKNNPRMYLQGASIAMPEKIQEQIIHSIPGLEKAKFLQYGYSVVYDFVPPDQIKNTLETKKISGLFLAGQINGTSGYEEAAAQGIMAGINATLAIKNKKPLILPRNEAYIGVLIDDLVTKIHHEPYRVYTSRAEYRLLLRQDNADIRLSKYGKKLDLINQKRFNKIVQKEKLIQKYLKLFHTKYLNAKQSKKHGKSVSYFQLLSTPHITYKEFKKITNVLDLPFEIENQLEIIAKYEGYLKKQENQAKEAKYNENKKIPENFDYDKVPGLRNEARIRLSEVQPQSLGQASRMAGVTYADLSILMIWLSKEARK